jgi:hypothetical protein
MYRIVQHLHVRHITAKSTTTGCFIKSEYGNTHKRNVWAQGNKQKMLKIKHFVSFSHLVNYTQQPLSIGQIISWHT